jgi:hypothetical protein
MLRSMLLLLLLAVTSQPAQQHSDAPNPAIDDAPDYTSDGQLKMPEHYREWIFLSSGVDMSYSPNAATAGHSLFDNVFVNPSAYRAFQQTGTWPDKTSQSWKFVEPKAPAPSTSADTRSHPKSWASRSTSRTPALKEGEASSISITPTAPN